MRELTASTAEAAFGSFPQADAPIQIDVEERRFSAALSPGK
jgi:hypothetical protein